MLHNIYRENVVNCVLKWSLLAVGPFSRNKSHILIYMHVYIRTPKDKQTYKNTDTHSMLSLQRPYVQIFQNPLFCIFWNFSIAAIFWLHIYSRMSILIYRKLVLKASKYCQFILQKPYVQKARPYVHLWT